jgi:hypothetical protein
MRRRLKPPTERGGRRDTSLRKNEEAAKAADGEGWPEGYLPPEE